MTIDLRKGFGNFEGYKLFKFPDNSIKFEQKQPINFSDSLIVKVAFKNSEDFITLGLILDYLAPNKVWVQIHYMMYQQDDRRFSQRESFGLKFIASYLNSFKNASYSIFHPHSDKVEFINNLEIIPNDDFVKTSLMNINKPDALWVIPDAGAFKTQFKQAQEMDREFLTCMKSRDHKTGKLTTIVETDDLQGRDCFIVDDICIGGRTFMGIAKELQKKNAGKLYLLISHGIFEYGIDELLGYFETIYTTNSVCTIGEKKGLVTFEVKI